MDQVYLSISGHASTEDTLTVKGLVTAEFMRHCQHNNANTYNPRLLGSSQYMIVIPNKYWRGGFMDPTMIGKGVYDEISKAINELKIPVFLYHKKEIFSRIRLANVMRKPHGTWIDYATINQTREFGGHLGTILKTMGRYTEDSSIKQVINKPDLHFGLFREEENQTIW